MTDDERPILGWPWHQMPASLLLETDETAQYIAARFEGEAGSHISLACKRELESCASLHVHLPGEMASFLGLVRLDTN